MAKHASRRRDDDDDERAKTSPSSKTAACRSCSTSRELRDRVRNAAIAFIVAFVVCWYFAERHLRLAEACRCSTSWDAQQGRLGAARARSYLGGSTEPFWVDMSVGMWAGIFVVVAVHLLSAVEVHRARPLQARAPRRRRVRGVLGGLLRRRRAVLLLLRPREPLRLPASATRRATLKPHDHDAGLPRPDARHDARVRRGVRAAAADLLPRDGRPRHAPRPVEVQPLVHRARVHHRRDPDAVARRGVADA